MKTYFSGFFLTFIIIVGMGHSTNASNVQKESLSSITPSTLEAELITNMTTQSVSDSLEMATFGAGCFWCVEAIYELVEGIVHVESGYSGGYLEDPTYKEVITGRTGHAEVARIHFNPKVINYDELLQILWHTHNPTTLNRQGNDVGTQYRSVIYYHNEEQKGIAEASKEAVDATDLWEDPIITTIEPLTNYYVAENYHQDYFENNPTAGYCSFVIAPKVQKFKNEFAHLLKENKS